MEYTIRFTWDPEAKVWYSESDQIPISLESDNLDTLMNRIHTALPEIAELNNLPSPTRLMFLTGMREEIYA